MAVDQLNFFQPYESLPPNHENQLTRAFLTVLRYCPAAHQAWLSMVDPGRKLHDLPKPTFQTQRARILEEDDSASNEEEVPGLSVICAADIPLDEAVICCESDRGQVLDGIIRYENHLVIVLESKLDGPVNDRQAREINLHDQPVRFEGNVRRLSWRNVLETFEQLASEDRAITSGAERLVLRDFLEVTNQHFPSLGPYSTLERCRGEKSRVERRLLAALMDGVKGDPLADGVILPGTHQAIRSAHVGYNEAEQLVQLCMYPADTLSQAKTFYTRAGIPERVLSLRDQGWQLKPNLHFGFMASGLTWTNATASVEEYVRYWQKNIADTKQSKSAEWPSLWKRVLANGFAQEDDRSQFDRDFTSTKRKVASIRPGLRCKFTWRLADAAKLDAAGKFSLELREKVVNLLSAIGEPLPS